MKFSFSFSICLELLNFEFNGLTLSQPAVLTNVKGNGHSLILLFTCTFKLKTTAINYSLTFEEMNSKMNFPQHIDFPLYQSGSQIHIIHSNEKLSLKWIEEYNNNKLLY